MQKRAYKIIYAQNLDYNTMIEEGKAETLFVRRERKMLEFALKNKDSQRFGARWFKKNPDTEVTVRQTTRRPYSEKFCRTERSKSNPIYYMTKLLNDEATKQ